jgi:hypothetical protein
MPPNYNGGGAYQYVPLLNTTAHPQSFPMAGGGIAIILQQYLAALAAGAVASEASSAPCCVWAANGCGCGCSRRLGGIGGALRGASVHGVGAAVGNVDALHQGYGGPGYAQAAVDWPSVGQKMGFGPGPYVQYPEVFPLHGRANLAPFRGY